MTTFESVLKLQQEALTQIHTAKRDYIVQEGWVRSDETRWSKGPFGNFSVSEAFDVEVRYKREGKFPTRLKSKDEDDD
jgi:hypothetical protein